MSFIVRVFQGSEDPARQLISHIAELQTRLAHPQHWTEGENTNNAVKLQQLMLELRRRQAEGDLDPISEVSTR